MEELGGAHTHNTRSGVAHYLADGRGRRASTTRARCSAICPTRTCRIRPTSPSDFEFETNDLDQKLNTLIPDSPNQPYDIHEVIEVIADDGEFLETQPLFAPNIVVGFVADRGPLGRHHREPAAADGRHPQHRGRREGRAVHAILRRVLDPGRDPRRRSGLPARHRPGVDGRHPPRREAAVRLRRGDGPARDRSSCARPTAARTSSWDPSSSAPT